MGKVQKLKYVIVGISLSLFAGCGSTTGGKDDGSLGWGTRALLCTGGGVAGGYIAKKLADKYFERNGGQFDNMEIEAYTKAFQLGLFVTFCKLADYAGTTIYKKLSDEGEKKRREQVLSAAASAKTTTYTDPSNPSLTGTVKPTKTYTESIANRECVDMEDTLADTSSSETIYLKYCRDLPSGTYAPVTV